MTAKQVQLFGYWVDALRMDEAVGVIARWIDAPYRGCRYVVTPNVHHSCMYQWHEGLRRSYSEAALVLADGMPVVKASRWLRRPLPQRVTGSDLVPALFDHYRGRHLRVFLLGAAEGVAHRAAEQIAATWQGIDVCDFYSPPLGFEKSPEENSVILQRIRVAMPDVLVVGLGAPKQELWVHAHYRNLEAKVALCVGATIDFLAQHKPRAPAWMQKAGLEWAHRLLSEPRRLAGRYGHDALAFSTLFGREAAEAAWARLRQGKSAGDRFIRLRPHDADYEPAASDAGATHRGTGPELLEVR